MKRTSAAVLLASLAGCASVDYQPLDGTKRVFSLQERYCATADPEQRALLLGTMRALGLEIPTSGVCTDLLSLIDPAAFVDIDVEQARRDQQRFQNADRDSQPAVNSEVDPEGSQEP